VDPAQKPAVRIVGRYALHGVIAAGGMATVHFGRLLGPVGFSRTVAIKRLHAQFAADPEFVSMFLDEARLVARIRHPNVIPTLDVVATSGELFLVMEYVPGESLARLARVMRDRGERIPDRVVSAIMAGTLHGLHAAHEAKDERGEPLNIVHRDVSPQNVLVGTDGVARVIDFGVAKAAGRMQTTREGQIKGKLSYMPPEQLKGEPVTRKADIYSASVLLWELLTGQRLFGGDNEGVIVARVLEGKVVPPSKMVANLKLPMPNASWQALDALDALVMRGLSSDPAARFGTAREMAMALERAIPPATAAEVGEWVETHARDVLSYRAERVAEIESSASARASPDKLMDALHSGTTAPPGGRITSATPFSSDAPTKTAVLSEPAGSAMQTRVSVVGPARPQTAKPRPMAFAFGALVLAVATMVGVVLFITSKKKSAPAAERSADPISSATSASVVETSASASAVASASASTSASGSAVAAASGGRGGTKPPTNGGGRVKLVTGPATAPAAATTTAAPSDCNPPYTWGPDGIKVYKKHCPLN
jgi:serine/threonine-protein kinase